MNNYLVMPNEFEKAKNRNASALTLGIAGALLLLFFMLKWPLPSGDTAYGEEYIEIDLGDSETGAGLEEDMRPGEPAAAVAQIDNIPQTTPAPPETSRDVETDDNAPDDVPVIRRPTTPDRNARRVVPETRPVRTTTTTATPAPAPPQPRLRAVAGRTLGGNGNGGNGAETYSPGGGDGTGGTGNQGSVGGNPNGRGTGTPRNFGVQVFDIPAQSFEDDFNENAKVAMDVVAGENGKVLSATYQPRGSTTSNRKMIDIARRRAFELKLGSSTGGQKGTVVFNFKVRG